ncbi:helix-hairpin-helix domain-containing protein [Daejeonella sp.]|jgi:competence protein ComEA|uniref:helix-hairpin-helix domain-containing protein n=1 Tax=Daejeonella sp. TaxID=2805397 RepID=UPI0037C1A7CC
MQGIVTSIKSFLSFSKKELNGIFLLVTLIIIVLAGPWFFKKLSKSSKYNFENFKREAESFKNASQLNLVNDVKINISKVQYFKFDPNSISDSEWAQLGLSDKQINVLRNYVNKGGKFFKKEDLKRIYSIPESQYQLLEPYIHITEIKSERKSATKITFSKAAQSNLKSQFSVIEINSADSVTLLKIRGIGPSFASRIIRFRNRLGGFYKLEQLQEVYGIDSLKFSQIKDQIRVDSDLIQKINVNTATFEQFKKQPYLSYKQINALIQYRRQHGNFKTIDDLKKIMVLNEEIIRKIEPYFSF